ncbi:MAG TPA: DUF559 domain-containing protein [Thermoleophilaceae bacterium]
MRDARIAAVAGRQFNRVTRAQLQGIGLSPRAIKHRVDAGRLVIVEQGVYALAPVLVDDWGRWMGATLTAPGSFLSHWSAGAAWGFWGLPRGIETVTRHGRGGPRRHGGVLVFRSSTLDGATTVRRGVPITSVVRTLVDLAARVSDRALRRALREAIRLELATLGVIADTLGRGLRGSARLASAISSYSGLPLERARSGAEVRALEVLRDAGLLLPRLNCDVAGEEADLSWPAERLIIEIDGGPFHLDAGEDARKQAIWEGAGWTVRRIDSDRVYDSPGRLLALVLPNVPRLPL